MFRIPWRKLLRIQISVRRFPNRSRSGVSAAGSAFTLIELLAVIVIILILAAIVIPLLQNAKKHAAVATNIANLRVLGSAYMFYAGDNNGELPPGKPPVAGVRQAWFASAQAFDSPARKLFDKGNPKWGVHAQGTVDYLTSPEPLYSTIRKTAIPRAKGEFSTDGQYGYLFMYSPLDTPLIPGFFNDRTLRGSKMPICSDFFGPSYRADQFASDQCAVLYLDGSVRTFSQAELTKRDYTQRFRYLIAN